MHIRTHLTLSSLGRIKVPGLRHLLTTALAAEAARRQRKALSNLDDHLLCDIGLDRHEAAAEAARPVWDAPLHWKA
jgi:uncharacterized protein YjiS (DUF1127 family)